jgi:hypothetical protein
VRRRTILDGEANERKLSEFSGIAAWCSGQIRVGGVTEDVLQAGLEFPDGRTLALVEIPSKKKGETLKTLTQATGLDIVQIGQP